MNCAFKKKYAPFPEAMFRIYQNMFFAEMIDYQI